MGYTDGTGVNGMAASAVHSEDWRGSKSETYVSFPGPLSTVAGSERGAVALGLDSEVADLLFLLTDSQTALRTAVNLSRGHPPRSGVEVRLKQALHKRRDKDTAIAWIRGHTGIPGNEKADVRATYES